MTDFSDITNKLYWTKGFEDGVSTERERILEALRSKAASRTVFETLSAPFYIEELEAAIMEGQ